MFGKQLILSAAILIAGGVSMLSAAEPPRAVLLKPARVFDGVDGKLHAGWQVLVEGERIAAVGPNLTAPSGADVIDLPNETLMPGMIEGHTHLFLHPYNETTWDDQVLHEHLALRTARAVVQAKATLLAGFTSARDLGTEGAGYADVGLKQAINQGIIPGPRLSVSTLAIVALGAYGRRASSPASRSRKAPRKPPAPMGSWRRRAAKSPPARIGSNFMPTTAGGRARTAVPP